MVVDSIVIINLTMGMVFLPPSGLLQGSIQFVSNVYFARTLLGEEITKRSLVATAVIVVGNVRAQGG
jgi:hypothetical protein